MTTDSFRNRRNGFQTMGNNSGSPELNNAGKAIGIIAVIVALIILIFNSAYRTILRR